MSRIFPRTWVVDFETFSACDIKSSGAYRYSIDPSTEALCFSFIEAEDPLQEPFLWLPDDPFPIKRYTDFKFAAHNAEFEVYIWRNVMTRLYGWPKCPPPSRWIDTAAICRHRGYPGKLENAGHALKLTKQKNMDGHRVMLKLSKPRKPTKNNPSTRWTPENAAADFEKLYDYCCDDVLSERDILLLLEPLPPQEQQVWEQNLKINLRGVSCDPYLADRVVKLKDYHLDQLNKKMAIATGGKIQKTTQTAALTKFLKFPSLSREFLEQKADAFIRTPKQREIVNLRLAASRTSTSKFDALLASYNPKDYLMHGVLMYHAASQTGRFGGSIIQPHNLPRPKLGQDEVERALDMFYDDMDIMHLYEKLDATYGDKIMDLFSDMVRSAIMCRDGNLLCVSDYANVEARILAWEADETILLKDFRAGVDPYLGMASDIYRRKITKQEKFERSLGKACVLGAGFGMSGYKFWITCNSWGIPIDLELAEKCIKIYRNRHKKIVNMWYDLNEKVLDCVDNHVAVEAGKSMWRMVNWPRPALECTLPSGKTAYYPEPEIRQVPAPWDDEKIIDQLYYKTWDNKINRFVSVSTYGAKLVENITQGVAAELLKHALKEIEAEQIPVVLHVHDEIIADVEDRKAEEVLKIMTEIMSTPPSWAKGLPLAAEGFINARFKKG